MLHIDPELLNNANPSPYRSALQKGYNGLLFDGEIETEFQAFYTEGHLLRVRLAAYMIVVLFIAFVGIDLATLPSAVAYWTTKIRLFVLLPPVLVLLYITYRPALLDYVGRAVYACTLVAGVGTVAVIGTAYSLGTQIPYEGILLVALFVYLIACLQWRRAVISNTLTLVCFIVMEVLYQPTRRRGCTISFSWSPPTPWGHTAATSSSTARALTSSSTSCSTNLPSLMS